MVTWALGAGYVGLFALSFVAATLVAAPSDVVAMAMVAGGLSAWGVGAVATVGGLLGNMVNYAVGRYGAAFFASRWVDAEAGGLWRARAERVYERYGVYSLLLSGLPFIGDPLTVVGGVFRVRWTVFVGLVLLGKVVKFALLLGGAAWLR